jgi:hypothetical protein
MVVVGATIVLTFSGGASALPDGGGGAPDDAVVGAAGRAAAVALDVTGGGRVTATEVDHATSRYKVEVTLATGEQVDVVLDETFQVVGTYADAGAGD